MNLCHCAKTLDDMVKSLEFCKKGKYEASISFLPRLEQGSSSSCTCCSADGNVIPPRSLPVPSRAWAWLGIEIAGKISGSMKMGGG